ncbi:hypothetical protein NUW58_g7807 [Xylaria curta]|uniref:Uncharacterized protein n=1 Tax=Xylaria curta TaxID=42375 RepID=A0ACC1NDV6_9PEZI|nr:hypothetical protein NUW58_g7807 [Xylaria curta]
MTDQVAGSSLPQTRDFDHQQHHQHEQQQQQRRHTHLHFRDEQSSHHRSHQHLHHARSQRNRRLHDRDVPDDNEDIISDIASDIVVVVQTISVLQVTDFAGSTIIRTLPHDYPTPPVVTGSQPVSTIAGDTEKPSPTDLQYATSIGGGSSSSSRSSGSSSDDGNGDANPSSSSSSSIEDPTVIPSGSSMPTSFPTLSYAPITSTPLSATPVFPSFSGLSNSTLPPLAHSNSSAPGNSSVSLHSFTSEGNFSILGSATGTRSGTSRPSSSVTHSVFGTSTSQSPSVTYTYFTSTAKPDATPANGGTEIGTPADITYGDGPASTAARGGNRTGR